MRGRAAYRLQLRESKFRREVALLEYHYIKMEESFQFKGGELLLQIFKLIGGILSICLTTLWIIHICVYYCPIILDKPPIAYFLNDVLEGISGIPVVGITCFTILVFYLFLATVKGVEKVGMRILFVEIHPLKIGETMISSMLFNIGIILTCSLSITQFCGIALDKYSRYSVASGLFGRQLRFFRYLRYGFEFAPFLLLLVFLISALSVVYGKTKKRKDQDQTF